MTPLIDEIIEDITSGTAVEVSDGSFKELFGTVSWIIEKYKGNPADNGKCVNFWIPIRP